MTRPIDKYYNNKFQIPEHQIQHFVNALYNEGFFPDGISYKKVINALKKYDLVYKLQTANCPYCDTPYCHIVIDFDSLPGSHICPSCGNAFNLLVNEKGFIALEKIVS